MDPALDNLRNVPSTVPVLVAGAGPVGLVTALYLSRHGVPCLLAERSMQTTRWPKMDLTNCRSMELLSRMGLVQGLRSCGVPQHFDLRTIVTTGISDGGEILADWDTMSPEVLEKLIAEKNDGTLPRFAYQRCSQALLEAFFRTVVEADPLIQSYWGMRFDSLIETDDGVSITLIDVASGRKHVVRSQYVIGADGGGSRVRRSIGINCSGEALPIAMHLVHFRSRDLETLYRHGRFWHVYNTNGSVMVNQDEKEIFTVHMSSSLDTDPETLDPMETIATAVGGSTGKLPIKVDEIIVASTWRPTGAVADSYCSKLRRVFLAGDAAHQNVPVGGFGMNSGIADAYDIGWKVVALVKGYGGPALISSYEIERRPVALRNIDLSGKLIQAHTTYWEWVREAGDAVVTSDKPAGRDLRTKITRLMTERDYENRLLGFEMSYRYDGSPIVLTEDVVNEPHCSAWAYVPTTWPGSRPPHVFLSDGRTSIFDLFGQDFTIVDFTADGSLSTAFVQRAAELCIPLKRVHLPGEHHVQKIWERDVVLIRPDDHVAWRLSQGAEHELPDVEQILLVAVGKKALDGFVPAPCSSHDKYLRDLSFEGNSIVQVGAGDSQIFDEDDVELRAEFQV